jgi:isopenicillin-N epimerase
MPAARLLFSLDPAVAHLNHGSFGAVPIPVQRAQQRLRDEAEANPMRFHARGLLDRVTHTRRHIATFLGADPDGSALVPNVTAAVTTVLESLELQPSDEVVSTVHGYGAVEIATSYVCARTGATHRAVALPLTPTDDEVVDGIRRALTGRTRLVVVDQVSSHTARLFPVERVTAVAHDAGAAVLVDGAHVPGQLPVRVDSIGADFWTGNLHKWAYAPRGTAILTVARPWRDRIRPPAVSWWQAEGFPASVERQGTADLTPWLAAPTGLFILRTLGLDAVRGHNAALARYGQAVVGDALGVRPADLPAPPPGLAMAIVPLPTGLVTDLPSATHWRQRIADELAAEVALNAWQGRGLLRLSAQVYNRVEDYDRLAERLPALLATR